MKTVSIYNFLHALISVCGGFCSYWLGGYDLLLKTVICLTVLDFITGTGQAIYNKTFTEKRTLSNIMLLRVRCISF